MRKHKLTFFLVFIGYGLGTALDGVVKPYIYKQLIDGFTSGSSPDIILAQVTHLAIILTIIILTYVSLFRIGDFSIGYFENKVMKKLTDSSFDTLISHSYNFFSNNFSGGLVAKVKRFSKSFETSFDVASQIWQTLVILVCIIAVLFFKAPTIAVLFLVWSIVYVFITLLFIRKKVVLDYERSAADSKVTGYLADSISNILNIKIFSKQKNEENDFAQVTAYEERKRFNAWQFHNFQNLAQGTLMAILQTIVVFSYIHLWYQGIIGVGTIVLIQAYMIGLFDHLWGLGRHMTKGFEALIDMQEMVDILEAIPDILDPKKPEVLKVKDGKIELNSVTFAYNDAGKVFENLSITINFGERVGFVGHSGAGKSTITKLLLRFADLDSGVILIDGQDITKITQNDLRSVISYVPQESILFHRTIGENIAYSKLGASQEEIEEAATKAHAHEFISKLPHGYDTLVGERGVKLSGGERQRVAIARAMLKDSPILMLDEATSSLDSISESYIQDAFNELMKGKTTIVIAHRLSTIQKMDRIIVLDKGKIVEEGTHQELLAKNGFYAELWNHQTGGFLE
jgi:ATP-binding cassette subfamily B protein